jgi:hypothetical protein
MTSTTPQAMAVCADDVAFRRLGEDLLTVLQCRAAGAEREGLLSRIAMIEVHLVRRKSAPAVVAGHVSQLSQECGRRVLPTPDALDLLLAICRVVPDICRALVPCARYGSI